MKVITVTQLAHKTLVTRKGKKVYRLRYGGYIAKTDALIVATRFDGCQFVTRGTPGRETVLVPVGQDYVGEAGDQIAWYDGGQCGRTALAAGKIYRRIWGGSPAVSSTWVELL